jgi:putative endonuclease
MYYVYVLKSTTRNYLYVGLTNSLERRLKEHNAGYNKTTKPYSPFTLLLVEQYSLRSEARNREKYLKSGIGKEFIRNNYLIKQE